mgnify:CR=1 FL=1
MSQFKFPDEQEDTNIEAKVEVKEDEVEIEIVDDTPEKDRGRKPLEHEVEEPTEDELDEYSEKVQARIKELREEAMQEKLKKTEGPKPAAEAKNLVDA